MYRNICELRQFKHCLGRDVSAVKDFSICNGGKRGEGGLTKGNRRSEGERRRRGWGEEEEEEEDWVRWM